MDLKQLHVLLILMCLIVLPGTVSGQDDAVSLAKKHFSFAVQNKNNGDFEEAERQFLKSLSFTDSIYNVHYSYGDLLVKMERPGNAMLSFRKSLSLNPGHYNSAAMLAKLHYESAEYDSALVMYRLMSDLKPGDSNVLASVAGLSEYLGYDDEAYAAYVDMFEEGDHSPKLLHRIARLALKRGDPGSARSYADQALIRKPDDIDALTIAGEASIVLRNPKAASGYYRQLAVVDSLSVETLVILEDLYRILSDRLNLIWTLERHHSLVPDDVVVIGELSELLYAGNMMEKGITYVRKGIEIAPDDGRFRILHGEYYRSLGQIDKALAEFKIAIEDPEWKTSAQRLIWQIEKPESEEEKAEREFFKRGR